MTLLLINKGNFTQWLNSLKYNPLGYKGWQWERMQILDYEEHGTYYLCVTYFHSATKRIQMIYYTNTTDTTKVEMDRIKHTIDEFLNTTEFWKSVDKPRIDKNNFE